jgi:DNA excision repair protein ERCC-4
MTSKPSSGEKNSPGEESDSNVSDVLGEPIVPTGMLPSFLADAFEELYTEDGLVCLGKGLHCLMLLAAFVRFYADTEAGHVAFLEEDERNDKDANTSLPRKRPLVLVLGLSDSERSTLLSVLESWGTPPGMLPVSITNESGQAKEREALYQQGGVLLITSRILIVDLLTNTAICDDIDGMLVAHGEAVTEQSTEAFILRIYQSQKQPTGSGFVKAFSETADQLTAGFARVRSFHQV